MSEEGEPENKMKKGQIKRFKIRIHRFQSFQKSTTKRLTVKEKENKNVKNKRITTTNLNQVQSCVILSKSFNYSRVCQFPHMLTLGAGLSGL